MDNITNNDNIALEVIDATGTNGDVLPRKEETAFGITYLRIRTDFQSATTGETNPELANFPFIETGMRNEHMEYGREQILGFCGELALNSDTKIDWHDRETRFSIFAKFIEAHDFIMTCDTLDGMRKGYGSFARDME